MNPLLTVLNFLLVLALVAGGIGPVSAEHRTAPDTGEVATAPCHAESLAEPAEPADPFSHDCCDGNTCTCDCLHHSQWLVEMVPAPQPARPDAARLALRDFPAPSPAPRPPLRPPIA